MTPNPTQALSPLLNVALWLPFAGAILIFLLPRRTEGAARWIAAVTSFITLVLALQLFSILHQIGPSIPDPSRDAAAWTPQFVTSVPWLAQLSVRYAIGLDGLSGPMFLLNALLVFLAVLVSWNTTHRPREYFALVLVLETAVSGVFASLDLLLFFLFWELELVPMYFLIGIWGGERREYAAMKFILYTIAGSAFMLVGIFVLFLAAPSPSFDLIYLSAQQFSPVAQSLAWILLFIGFAVKIPVFPLHTWLSDAHTEAPTAMSVLLAGILLKMGAYGLIRMNIGILPDATRQFAFALVALAVVNIFYGALVAMTQTDLKRVIANSSISHMGYVVLGAAALTPMGLEGAVFQMFSHGAITGLLFMAVGLIYDRTHTRRIADLGGLAGRMPFVAVIFVIASFASLGLPGLSGFVSEFLVFMGAFPRWGVATIIGVITIALTAGYMLWLVERVFWGAEKPQWQHIIDANHREIVTVSALIFVILVVGLFPSILGTMISAAIAPVAARY
jgi:NADH-quinone oxidoreductase subunit M